MTNKYLVTFVCGDTYNIPTYKIIECKEGELGEKLDNDYDIVYSWRISRFVKIYRVEEVLQ